MTTYDDLTLEQAGLAYLTGTTFTDEAFFHAAAAKLRAEDPIHWVEHPDFNPFYVLTKHADVLEVELHQNEFLNAPRAILGTKESDAMRAMQGHLVKSLVQMDDPEHRSHRNLTAEWFLPKNLAKLDTRLAELAERSMARMEELGGECDFASEIAMQYPLYVILAILGLPETDYPRMLKLTQELFGAEDDDFKRDDDVLAGIMAVPARHGENQGSGRAGLHPRLEDASAQPSRRGASRRGWGLGSCLTGSLPGLWHSSSVADVALFEPRVAVLVIPERLPEPRLVVVAQLDGVDPLG